MPPSLVKPARWNIQHGLLTPEGRGLARGLVDLLPFWDDGGPFNHVIPNYGYDYFAGASPKSAFTNNNLPTDQRREPTSRGVGWLGTLADNAQIGTTADVDASAEWATSWTCLYVFRLDTNTVDTGLLSHRSASTLYWYDTVSSQMRLGADLPGVGPTYGPTFHGAADNGTTYVVAIRNDDENTRTDLWLDGVNHISEAAKQVDTAAERIYIFSQELTGRRMYGAAVGFARWNRALTDDEVQRISYDPWMVARRAVPYPIIGAAPPTPPIEVTVTDTAGVADTVDTTFAGVISVTVTESAGVSDTIDAQIVVPVDHVVDIVDDVEVSDTVVPRIPTGLRQQTAALIQAAMPPGVTVYPYPAEQIKTPAVVIGSMDWAPATQNALKAVQWDMTIPVAVSRSAPEYGVPTLESLSLQVARSLLQGGYRVVEWTGGDTQPVGGTDHLQGSLNVQYRSEGDEQ